MYSFNIAPIFVVYKSKKRKIMGKLIYNNKMFSINLFIIASIALFYYNSTSISSDFWGYQTKTIVTIDGCYSTETTYKTYYKFWMATDDSTITDIKISDSKCF